MNPWFLAPHNAFSRAMQNILLMAAGANLLLLFLAGIRGNTDAALLAGLCFLLNTGLGWRTDK